MVRAFTDHGKKKVKKKKLKEESHREVPLGSGGLTKTGGHPKEPVKLWGH